MPGKNTVAVVLTEELERKLRDVAREDTVPISAVVRQALRRFFVARDATHSTVPATQPSDGQEVA